MDHYNEIIYGDGIKIERQKNCNSEKKLTAVQFGFGIQISGAPCFKFRIVFLYT